MRRDQKLNLGKPLREPETDSLLPADMKVSVGLVDENDSRHVHVERRTVGAHDAQAAEGSDHVSNDVDHERDPVSVAQIAELEDARPALHPQAIGVDAVDRRVVGQETVVQKRQHIPEDFLCPLPILESTKLELLEPSRRLEQRGILAKETHQTSLVIWSHHDAKRIRPVAGQSTERPYPATSQPAGLSAQGPRHGPLSLVRR